MESFFHTLKTEHVHLCAFKTREEARTSIFEYIEVFYNRKRLHATLGYRTPQETEDSWGKQNSAVALDPRTSPRKHRERATTQLVESMRAEKKKFEFVVSRKRLQYHINCRANTKANIEKDSIIPRAAQVLPKIAGCLAAA